MRKMRRTRRNAGLLARGQDQNSPSNPFPPHTPHHTKPNQIKPQNASRLRWREMDERAGEWTLSQELLDRNLEKIREQEKELDRLRRALSSRKAGGKGAVGRSPSDVRKIKVWLDDGVVVGILTTLATSPVLYIALPARGCSLSHPSPPGSTLMIARLVDPFQNILFLGEATVKC